MVGSAHSPYSHQVIREAPERSHEAARPPFHRTADRRGLLVELFGPAAAGKTTLARALGEELTGKGIAARVVSSARPTEKHRNGEPARAQFDLGLTAPLARARKVVAALATFAPGKRLDPLIPALISTIPPGSWARLVRTRRYLAQLCDDWRAASTSSEVVIFDQGFLTALCSLALHAGSIDSGAMARALALVPEPDLLIRIDTPRATLTARLEKRLRRQGRLERLFENEITVSLRQQDLSAALDGLLEGHGRNSMRVSWLDREGLARVVDRVTGEIVSRGRGVAA